jgi:hypothetical protein
VTDNTAKEGMIKEPYWATPATATLDTFKTAIKKPHIKSVDLLLCLKDSLP